MISKLRFSLIAVIMLVLLGFGFQDQAKGQIGDVFCPAVPNTTGYLETEIVGSGLVLPDFTGGLIGTVESIPNGVDLVGGLDWQHVDQLGFFGFTDTPTPTNETGSQLVSWWTQKDGRNTYLQVTNASSSSVTVHVRIHNEDCLEIRDFCDTYTPYDTHEYNFGDLVSNGGQNISEGNLQDVEGWLVVTAVDDECDTDGEQAIDHNYLAGQLVVHDSDDYLYGVNTYARHAICEDDTIDVNRVFNGSYQLGSDGWFQRLQVARVIDPLLEITPFQIPPFNPYFSELAAFVISADVSENGSNTTYNGGSFDNLDTVTLVNAGLLDQDVAIWESAVFDVFPGDSSTLSYNLQFYTGEDFFSVCGNYAAVRLIQVDPNVAGAGIVRDSTCYQQIGTVAPGAIETTNAVAPTKPCTLLADSDDDIAYDIYEFDGRTGFQLGETLSTQGATGQFRIQVVTGIADLVTPACFVQSLITEQETGALVNNFELIGQDDASCLGPLTGDANARLDSINPDTLFGQFNVLPGNVSAGSDAVLINFADSYGFFGLGPYRPIPAFSLISVSIFDDIENAESCGDALVCFTRLGVDDNVIPSEDFVPPTIAPTATPTTGPTATPTTAPTDTPTPTGTGNGGSSSCAIAGNPVQLGTALANVLIPLVPVAFAFGVRAVRRRKK